MNEIDLIVKYLEKNNSEVLDMAYYSRHSILTVAHEYVVVASAGALEGSDEEVKSFFCGNVSLMVSMEGVVNVVDRNQINIAFGTYNKNGRSEGPAINFAPGHNLFLLGDGIYSGEKRLYGLGCTGMGVDTTDIGAATFSVVVCFNGYLFQIR